MSFHRIHGSKLSLKKNGTVSSIVRGVGTRVVFSDQPLKPRDGIELTVLDASRFRLHSYMVVGVTITDPTEYDLSKWPSGQKESWCLDTYEGHVYLKGRNAGKCDKWKRNFGIHRHLENEDKIRITMSDERTITIGCNDFEIPNAFSYPLPEGNVWAVIGQNTWTIDIRHLEIIIPPCVTELKKQEISEKEAATFIAKVTGKPEPKVEWVKNKKKLFPSENVFLDNRAPYFTLQIKNCEVQDSGTISVTATNKAGSASAEAPLEVKEVSSGPSLTELDDLKISDGEEARFMTTSSGLPPPKVEWYQGMRKLQPSNQIKIVAMKNQHRLIIKKCNFKTKGTFTAVATNKYGTCSVEATLFVQEKLEEPTLSKPENAETMEKGDAVFETWVTGKPQPIITWFREIQPLKISDCIRIEKVADGKSRLTLVKCPADMAGIIRVSATNEAGVAFQEAKLNIKGHHVFEVAKAFVSWLGGSKSYFDPTVDVCFCEPCHTVRGDSFKYLRGNPPKEFGLPVGWCKFGLRTKPQAEAKDIFTNWHVAYHGTRVENVLKILNSGDLLIPGDITPTGIELEIPMNHWDPKNPTMEPPPGHDVNMFYFSPSIRYAGCEVYAPVYNWQHPTTGQEHKIRAAFQVRIEPGTYETGPQTIGATADIDPLFDNNELEWFTKRRAVSILVGLLVKVEEKVSDADIEAMKQVAQEETVAQVSQIFEKQADVEST